MNSTKKFDKNDQLISIHSRNLNEINHTVLLFSKHFKLKQKKKISPIFAFRRKLFDIIYYSY